VVKLDKRLGWGVARNWGDFMETHAERLSGRAVKVASLAPALGDCRRQHELLLRRMVEESGS
jgi:hypothetical protein